MKFRSLFVVFTLTNGRKYLLQTENRKNCIIQTSGKLQNQSIDRSPNINSRYSDYSTQIKARGRKKEGESCIQTSDCQAPDLVCKSEDYDAFCRNLGHKGDSCRNDDECKNKLRCHGKPKKCETGIALEHEFCDGEPCVHPLICSSEHMCIKPGIKKEDESCDSDINQSKECQLGMKCVKIGENQVCRKGGKKREFESCYESDDCEPNLVCKPFIDEYDYDKEEIYKCVNSGNEGDDCTDQEECQVGLQCHWKQQKCMKGSLKVEEVCNELSCNSNLICSPKENDTYHCIKPGSKKEGEICDEDLNDSNECESGAVCMDSLCTVLGEHGQECTNDNDCSGFKVCHWKTKTCGPAAQMIGQSCESGSCDHSLICGPAQDIRDGYVCAKPKSKNEESSCDPVLNESKECISSTFCVAVGKNQNFCRFAGKKKLGESCSENLDCQQKLSCSHTALKTGEGICVDANKPLETLKRPNPDLEKKLVEPLPATRGTTPRALRRRFTQTHFKMRTRTAKPKSTADAGLTGKEKENPVRVKKLKKNKFLNQMELSLKSLLNRFKRTD